MKLLTFFAACALCTSAYAQSMSVEDLRAMVDEEMNKGNEYAEVLNDPDPARAQAAMKIMLNSGDPELVKIALEYGLFSADRAVQVEAVRAYFSTMPKTQMRFVREGEDTHGYYEAYLSRYFRVRENDSQEAVFFANFVSYNEKGACFEAEHFDQSRDEKGCFVRFLQDRMQISISGVWWDAVIDENGYLSSKAEIENVPLTMSVALR
ncbi:hypothetical protein MLD63_16295 [Paracoccus sp. TK19116]|uniref:HEAT repeat domain-containing protein n=1 Tax=Paracoccus albicereus TaxID=2922394 RepID=A0ABT1MUG9_9RHOB|nr:hypothetical protein [Paracoccus albicereus]MCQ0971984.1 hypothetical protein [Paracoccus albicereus]